MSKPKTAFKLILKSAFLTLMLSCVASELCGRDFVLTGLVKEFIEFLFVSGNTNGKVIRHGAVLSWLGSDIAQSSLTIVLCLSLCVLMFRAVFKNLLLLVINIFKRRNKAPVLPTVNFDSEALFGHGFSSSKQDPSDNLGSNQYDYQEK